MQHPLHISWGWFQDSNYIIIFWGVDSNVYAKQFIYASRYLDENELYIRIICIIKYKLQNFESTMVTKQKRETTPQLRRNEMNYYNNNQKAKKEHKTIPSNDITLTLC